MSAIKKKRLAAATTVYWFLLLYIIVALIWWFIELENQNRDILKYRLSDLDPEHPAFIQKKQIIEEETQRQTTKYILEGVTFLALIIFGAVYVYRAVRRQITMQQQEQNFMMAVTHELKTPIAVAQLNLETLQKHQLDEEKRQKLIRMTLQETNRLNHLATNILVSAQLEGGGYRSAREEIDFSALVSKNVLDFQQRFTERRWSTDIEPGIDIDGDTLLLEILLNNLLENAVKYSPKQSLITCTLKVQNQKIHLRVTDEGGGIPVEERKLIFEKFYRVGNEQTRSTKGTGLGLYLCKKIAEDHRGKIRIADNLPKGTEFTVSFDM